MNKILKNWAVAAAFVALALIGAQPVLAADMNFSTGASFLPGYRTVDGTDLNVMVTRLNGVSGGTYSGTYVGTFNGAIGGTTPAAGAFTTVGASSSILSTSPSAGVGYTTGAGCAVTQATSRTTGVTCTGTTGAITLFSAAGSATPASFTVTDTSVAATDTIIVNTKTATDLWETFVTAVAAGSFKITMFTTGGTTTEQPVFNFAVVKGSAN